MWSRRLEGVEQWTVWSRQTVSLPATTTDQTVFGVVVRAADVTTFEVEITSAVGVNARVQSMH
jgi:hypothetical protein